MRRWFLRSHTACGHKYCTTRAGVVIGRLRIQRIARRQRMPKIQRQEAATVGEWLRAEGAEDEMVDARDEVSDGIGPPEDRQHQRLRRPRLLTDSRLAPFEIYAAAPTPSDGTNATPRRHLRRQTIRTDRALSSSKSVKCSGNGRRREPALSQQPRPTCKSAQDAIGRGNIAKAIFGHAA